jgi:hypothetical protein
VEEEAAIAALEPQLVVVNDNVRGRHHSHWPLQKDARSIQPPASGIVGKVVALGWIARDRQAPSAQFPGARRMRPKQQQARETINPVTGLIHQVRKCLAACAAAYIVRRSWRAAE